jgi:hypothetical protein
MYSGGKTTVNGGPRVAPEWRLHQSDSIEKGVDTVTLHFRMNSSSPSSVSSSSKKQTFDPLRGFLLHVRQNVGIRVQREHDSRMAQSL